MGVQRVAGVLLDAEDGELHGYVEGRVCDVGLLVTQTHGADEAFVFDGPSGEIGPDKGRLCDDTLPALLGDLLSGFDAVTMAMSVITSPFRGKENRAKHTP